MEASAFDALLSEEQAMITSSVAEFARDQVQPRIEKIDHAGHHPEELWSEIGGLGLFGVLVPSELGGAGAGFLAHAGVVEMLARSAGLAGALVAAQGIVVDALVRSEASEVVAEWLDPLSGGTALGAPALSEDDDSRVACRASGAGPEVRVSGRKSCVPHPGRAAGYVVRARRDAEELLVWVRADADGLAHGPVEPNMGLRGLESGFLTLSDAPGRVLGGAALVEPVLSGARIAVSALLAGVGRGALQHAVRYAGERKQFNLTLDRFAAIQERLARSDARVEALRALVQGAARLRDRGEPHEIVAMRARLIAGETIPSVADDAVQVYGGYGYSREYPVERYYRDAHFPGFGEHQVARTVEALAAAAQ